MHFGRDLLNLECGISFRFLTYSKNNFISVAINCKKNGLNFEKEVISKAVSKVMDFYSIAQCIDGEKAEGKSTNVIQSGSKRFLPGGGVYAKLWAAVDKYDKERSIKNCLIASCDELNISHCAKCLDHPFLIIQASDLDSKNFCKQFGKVMLENKSTICIESNGLRKDGSVRLVKLLKCARQMFDSRVRIIIFGDPGVNSDIEEYFEKDFMMEAFSELPKLSQKKVKLLSEDQTEDKVAMLLKDLDRLKEENIKMKKELSCKVAQLSNMETELKNAEEKQTCVTDELIETRSKFKDLKEGMEVEVAEKNSLKDSLFDQQSKVVNLEKRCEQECRAKFENVTAELKELKTKQSISSKEDLVLIGQLKNENLLEKENYLKTATKLSECKEKNEISRERHLKKIEELELELGEVKESLNAQHSQLSVVTPRRLDLELATTDQLTQTKPVVISPTPLTILKSNLEKNRMGAASVVQKVYQSIKELKCDIKYSSEESIVKCNVTILKGRNILSYPILTHFSGDGHSEQESLVNAFANFVLSVSNYQEE